MIIFEYTIFDRGNTSTIIVMADTKGQCYGVATISRLIKIIGLFCRISSLLEGSFAKETYYLKEPTNRSHLISHPPLSLKSMFWRCAVIVSKYISSTVSRLIVDSIYLLTCLSATRGVGLSIVGVSIV